MKNPDSRPLSPTTGYLLLVYLKLQKLTENLQDLCRYMEQTEPWFDPENRCQN